MAIIKCPECKKDMSSTASACPHCGYAKRKRKPMGLGTGIVLVVFVAIVAGQFVDTPPTTAKAPEPKVEKTAAQLRADKIQAAFRITDGSHFQLTRHIKKNLKDPDSYEHIETRYGIEGDTVNLATTYRAKNSFNGFVVSTATAKANIDGTLIEVDMAE